MKKKSKIPKYGSIPRPQSPEEGVEEIILNRIPWENGDLEIIFKTDEFTSVCPTTGQPDFMTVIIKYIPDKYYIESKSMKFYLWSFREYGGHCEKIADKIAKDIMRAIDCKMVEVKTIQKPRGGLELTAIKKIEK